MKTSVKYFGLVDGP